MMDRLVTTKAAKSAVGPANMIPSIPKIMGRTTRRGIRNSTCLVMDSTSPFTGFPMAAKKLEEIS